MKPDIICGRAAVAALFERRPGDALRLFYLDALRPVVGPWCAGMAALRRPYRLVEPSELDEVAGTVHHGGVAAVAKPRDLPRIDPANPPRAPLLLILDGIGNPHNLGAIARSAAFFGVGDLVLAEGPGHAMPSNAAYRTAEGGLEWLGVTRTGDLPGLLEALKPHYRSVAATLDPDASPLEALPRDRPVALVLGNEERGVSPAALAACRRRVRIPGSGRVQSLNVAQAAAVLLHALA